ncbi:MAG TPA: FHA domain-containing protein [Myxococcota bacterium]|nr:FHA domain-containing protein [Myxococcota bacterium]HRY94647.1 FHA domain-containing protein [Myxococcota bacterium]HSA20593.1 FHA domain-containing protein [Myxococcota bacterium]
MERLRDFMKVTATLSAEQYAEQFPHPLLLLAPAGAALAELRHTQLASVEQAKASIDRFNASLLDFEPLWPNPKPGPEFPRKVFIGRDARRDLVINHATVSGRHACLALDADGLRWQLVDAGSTNGTMLRGKELRPGQAVPVRDGDVITFGKVDTLFFTPDGAYRFLRQYRLFSEAMRK